MHPQHVAPEHLAVHVFQITTQVTLTLAERQAQQAHEDRQIVTAARLHRERLLDQDFQQLLEAFLAVGLRFAPVQLTLETHTEGPEEAREDRLDQRLL